MKVKLQIINGPEDGKEFLFKKKYCTLGRSSDNDVIITLDNQISRIHAKVSINNNNELWLEDMNSRNGTFVNEDRLDEPYLLNPEEIFRVGKTYFQIIVEN